jgi:hypothetical protein
MPEAKLEHICSYTVDLKAPPEVIGPVPEGIRANFYITGGKIEGPRLRGEVLPVGADWLLLRRDGIGRVDVRATLRTHDGALIYGAYTGLVDLGEDGYDRFLSGDLPPSFPIRVAPIYQTAHPAYLWLNRLQCLNVGHVDLGRNRVSYDVFAAV